MNPSIANTDINMPIGGNASLPSMRAEHASSLASIDKKIRGSRDAKIMIVDDEQLNIDIVQAYLEEKGYLNFTTNTDSTVVVDRIQDHQPDILLLDIRMPKVSGLDILKTLRGDQTLLQLPVIILTSSTDAETKLEALRLGASDFLGKPVDPSELVLRIENVLAAKALRDHLKNYSERLELQVMLRTSELIQSRQEAIQCLARAGEYRDDDTGQHVVRVGRYSAIIADELGFPTAAIELLEQAAQLHDIGKIGIPDNILRKPGRLEKEEFNRMKHHCMIGCRIIDPLSFQRRTNDLQLNEHLLTRTKSPVLKLASTIAMSHHEKWDGSGYPAGLKGEDIPIEGRIVAIADVFDAVSSKRPYKPAFTLEKSLSIISEGKGNHFQPKMVDAFFARLDEIKQVRRQGDNCIEVESND